MRIMGNIFGVAICGVRTWRNVTLAMIGMLGLWAVSGVAAFGQDFSVLYDFTGTTGCSEDVPDGGHIAQGRDGNLYTTLIECGANGQGTILKTTPAGVGTVLYNFDGGVNGGYPVGGLILGTDGDFYGSAFWGGSSLCYGGCGTIFRVDSAGDVTVVHSLIGGTEGQHSAAPPIFGKDGNLYATVTYAGDVYPGCGELYQLTSKGVLTVRVQFNDTNGCYPQSPLIQSADGDFYGTTPGDGLLYSIRTGNVFKVTSKGEFKVLHTFTGKDGLLPNGPLVQGNDGNFYGTTASGGMATGRHHKGAGVVFKMTPSGALTILHTFDNSPGSVDGQTPGDGLVQATDGKFYGVTAYGGTLGSGTIFSIDASGNYSILYNFDYTTGYIPQTLIQHTNGMFYGYTQEGGAGGGVFYSLNNGLGPFITPVSSISSVGKQIGILGQGLLGTSSVSFNGTAATFTRISDSYLSATVPSGATSGPITVVTTSGTLTSNVNFVVTP